MSVIITTHIGQEILNHATTLSTLRLQSFQAYPYLYKGSLEPETKHANSYATDPQAIIAIATIDNELAGISTGIPVNSNSSIVTDIRKKLIASNIDISKYYYYGETIIVPKFRGKGLVTKLFLAQVKLIKLWGFTHVCAMTVVREDNHPLKPADYQSPDKIWEHLGLSRMNIQIEATWPTIQADGTVKSASNILEFWSKKT